MFQKSKKSKKLTSKQISGAQTGLDTLVGKDSTSFGERGWE
jgi:hypothetical protein